MMSTSDTTATSTTTTSHDPPPPTDQTSTDQEHQTSSTYQEHQEQQPAAVADQYLDSFPIGYRFNPTDKELLHYLSLRYQKQNLPPNRINEVNLYDYHPEYLTSPGRFKAYENEEWYFFTPRDRKYRNGDRPKRSAGGKGYWKATGVDKKILKVDDPTGGVVDKKILKVVDEPTGGVDKKKKKKKKILRDEEVKNEKKLGSKKTLVYYEGKPPHGTKTSWVMHEFKLDQTSIQKNSRADMLLNETVLCRIHIKKTKSSDNSTSTTSSGSRKNKLVHHADHSLSSPTEEEEEEEEEDVQEEEEEALCRDQTDVYNDMEDEHLICSNYDSIMQQYSPTDLHQILNNVDSSCSNSTTAAYSSNIMGAASSTAVCGAASNIMPLQTCPPTCWVTAPVRNDYYMYTSTGIGIVAPEMVSMPATHNSTLSNININIRQLGVDDQIQQQWDTWMSSLSSGLPAGHPRVSSLSSFVPAGHPPPPQILNVPQGCSLPPLSQMPPPMQQQGYHHHHHHHHQYSSSLWADHGNYNNIDGSSSSGIHKLLLHDHAIRRECRERHTASKENDTNISTTEHSEYLNAVGENLEGFDQTPFSKAFNGTTFPDCGWSRR